MSNNCELQTETDSFIMAIPDRALGESGVGIILIIIVIIIINSAIYAYKAKFIRWKKKKCNNLKCSRLSSNRSKLNYLAKTITLLKRIYVTCTFE